VNSRIYAGVLEHERLGPVAHRFRYPVYLYGFDLDELATLDRTLPGFGYNRTRIVSMHDRDYLDDGPGSIRDKLMRVLGAHGLAGEVARVELVTAARYFGHVFNPVSFHHCYGSDGALRCVVAEVNNTFGERHLYVLDALEARDGAHETRRPVPKAFHVSPFYDVQGDYRFRFGDLRAGLDVSIEVHRDGAPAFRARLTGTARPLTGGALAATLARYPLTAALTVPRILWQAGKLRFAKRLPVHDKPEPADTGTFRRRDPSWLERRAERLVLRALGRIRRGSLDVRLPGGRVVRLRGPEEGPEGVIEIRRHRFFTRLLTAGDIGLGEGYEHGDWDSPDVTAVLRLLVANRAEVESAAGPIARLTRPLERLRHALRRNDRRGSRRNIRAHYDLGNDFFALFLDRSMTYSSALFLEPGQSLERAQAAKLDAVLRKVGAGPGHRIAEIGCGWGSFAMRAARERGARVTGITLSREQRELAEGRAREQGLADRVEFRLEDYRSFAGTFDGVVSIEMLEAVGHRNLGAFFGAVDRLLAPGGRAVLQVITIAGQRYDEYRRRPDWVQKYIFPGGHLPSIEAMTRAMREGSGLVLQHLESFGEDYATTLAQWRRNLEARTAEARRLGYEEGFLRRWRYYFSYCEAGFRAGEVDVVQMVLGRPGEATPGPAVPGA
jgi:cyclopropane-fatty-acyl-phospholipid synthase